MSLVTVRTLLGQARSATVQLQGADIDITERLQQANIMMKSLQKIRDLIDGYHEVWFNESSETADKVDAVIKAP